VDKTQTFKEFLATQSTQVGLLDFIINLLLAAILAYLLGLLYKKYGATLSNRDSFSKNFILITMTTMLIISIVKSSLALSLGLVGALSIVRFRAAIKEPEELSYLFLTIAVGLGFGANQRVITLVAFALITIIICLKNVPNKSNLEQSLNLIISSNNPNEYELDKYVEALRNHFSAVKLIRVEDGNNNLEASFLIEAGDYQNIKQCTDELKKINSSLNITYLDNKSFV
jgi:uncharacterized membrane protein YhiD involved in acid resistance